MTQMKNAFIFPGQASQYIGMGKDLYENISNASDFVNRTTEIIGMDLKKYCFYGSEDDLKQTQITQPAIFVHSIAVRGILKEKGFYPDAVAGHSLGEYSALVAAGSLSYDDGLRLVKRRGELMQEAGEKFPGTMAAIIGLDKAQIYDLCDRVKDSGICQPANFNSPGQVAISGEKAAILKAIEVAREMGARKAVELEVSGAFHSPLMAFAQNGLKEALEITEFQDAEIPVFMNVHARPVQHKDDIRQLLFEQLTRPVLWEELVQNMVQSGISRFYEVGPGKVLTGLLKRIDKSVSCREIGTIEAISQMEQEVV